MKQKKILFVCKFNLFRSKFAEAYFNKYNKDKSIKAKSAGIIEVRRSLNPGEKERNNYIWKKFNLKFDTKSRTVTYNMLNSVDRIIIVADDVPKKALEHKRWNNKIQQWNIPDEHNGNQRNVNKSLKPLSKKLDELIKFLESKP